MRGAEHGHTLCFVSSLYPGPRGPGYRELTKQRVWPCSAPRTQPYPLVPCAVRRGQEKTQGARAHPPIPLDHHKMSYYYGHTHQPGGLYSAGNGAHVKCASQPLHPSGSPPRRRRGHTFSALHRECRGHPVARPAAARACSTARPLSPADASQRLHTKAVRGRRAVTRLHVAVESTLLSLSFYGSTNVCTSRLMRVRNGRTL